MAIEAEIVWTTASRGIKSPPHRNLVNSEANSPLPKILIATGTERAVQKSRDRLPAMESPRLTFSLPVNRSQLCESMQLRLTATAPCRLARQDAKVPIPLLRLAKPTGEMMKGGEDDRLSNLKT